MGDFSREFFFYNYCDDTLWWYKTEEWCCGNYQLNYYLSRLFIYSYSAVTLKNYHPEVLIDTIWRHEKSNIAIAFFIIPRCIVIFSVTKTTPNQARQFRQLRLQILSKRSDTNQHKRSPTLFWFQPRFVYLTRCNRGRLIIFLFCSQDGRLDAFIYDGTVSKTECMHNVNTCDTLELRMEWW